MEKPVFWEASRYVYPDYDVMAHAQKLLLVFRLHESAIGNQSSDVSFAMCALLLERLRFAVVSTLVLTSFRIPLNSPPSLVYLSSHSNRSLLFAR